MVTCKFLPTPLKNLAPAWVLIILCCIACTKDQNDPVDPEPDILDKIEQIEGVTVVELETTDHFARLFEITVEQPVDHNAPGGATFIQKIYLGHVDEELPVVFETEGYERSAHRTRELSSILECNQLAVEHRYFGESTPSPRDWQYLDIWQAANDHHRIAQIFKEIYPESWVSSGASKGGDAAIFHRRFFPGDVDATVAYVAPLLFEQRDQRFLELYQSWGDEACRTRMRDYQRNILLKIDSMPPLFEEYVESVGDFGDATDFSLPYTDIVYHAIREDYTFEFWSSETENCSTIPGANATARELFDHFIGVFDIFLFFSDYGVKFWTPYGYQALTELGNYAFDVSYLQDLDMDVPPLVEYNSPTDFDPSAMQDIQTWITSSATEMLFIYGEEDPWTIGAVDHPGSDNILTIVNPGTKHGTRIATLSASDQQLVLDKLEAWMSN